ncbi:MAG: hypothetical protein WB761_15790, partial [Solirubrobacteraceae bacterium]
MAGGNLLLLSHGYLGDLARRPALRGKHGPTPGSGIGAEILARVFPATRVLAPVMRALFARCS